MGAAHDRSDEFYSIAGSSKTPPNSKKRKAQEPPPTANDVEVIDLTSPSPKKRKKKQEQPREKRLKRWRPHPPSTYLEIRNRALTQRMFILDRQRDWTNPESPTETISLAGTTGNVYTITVDKLPSCNCPHALKGNQCKHIVYVLARVLRVPEHLEYQLSFVSTELQEIFAKAPPLPSEQAEGSKKDGNRKPLEGECPICSEDFEPENSSEEVIYCAAACGNNIHKHCFDKWAASGKGQGAVTCPFCRTPWKDDEDTLKKVAKDGPVNEDGYVNIAGQLGISGARDYSTYHQQWVRRRFGYDTPWS